MLCRTCTVLTVSATRLHLALNAYHELLQTMMAMEKTNDPQLRDSVNVMKSKELATGWTCMKVNQPARRPLSLPLFPFVKGEVLPATS